MPALWVSSYAGSNLQMEKEPSRPLYGQSFPRRRRPNPQSRCEFSYWFSLLCRHIYGNPDIYAAPDFSAFAGRCSGGFHYLRHDVFDCVMEKINSLDRRFSDCRLFFSYKDRHAQKLAEPQTKPTHGHIFAPIIPATQKQLFLITKKPLTKEWFSNGRIDWT